MTADFLDQARAQAQTFRRGLAVTFSPRKNQEKYVKEAGMDDEPVQLPIDGVLDLHTFKPREVRDLVPDYLVECQKRGILQVRIIHGKGIGNLRRTVHAILAKHPEVISFTFDHSQFGGWGATIVRLKSGSKP